MNSHVDDLIANEKKWKREFEKLRSIILGCDLAEEIKWGQPCYAYNGKNVVLIHGFKDYCAILFMKGALLKDRDGVLITQTEKVQAGRQIRFADAREIESLEAVIKKYIEEAIEIEKAGVKIEFKETKDFPIPEELQRAFDENEALKNAFYALTPGRQRAYLFHFSEPKQSKTKIARIEKNMDKILDGLGLND